MTSSRSIIPVVALSVILIAIGGDFLSILFPGVVHRLAVGSATMRKLSPWVLEKTAGGEAAEFFVVMRDQADLSGAAALATKEDKGRYVFETLLAQAQRTQEGLLGELRERRIEHQSFYIVNAILVTGDQSLAVELAGRDDVGRIEGNPTVAGIMPVDRDKSDLDQGDQNVTTGPLLIEPGVTYIRAPEVWAAGFTGAGIVIGGQDTGVRWDHPALRSQYRGWNGSTASHDYNWHDSVHNNGGGGQCGIDSIVPCDDDNHGTHTLGTALGTDGGANQIGVAPGAKFIACRNMDRGNGTPATYLECFQFFLAPYPVNGTAQQGDPSKAPDLTTNSWSCPPSEGCSPGTLQAAVEAQRAAGIMTIVAAGNEGSAGCSSLAEPPGIYDASYSIGAINASSGALASFSSRGPVTIDGSQRVKPDLTAPGVSVRSALRSGGYGAFSGTSMATPHVAGAVALLWSAYPTLRGRIDATEDILNRSAVRIDSTACGVQGIPNALFGHGRLDIKAAFDLAATTSYSISGQVRSNGNGMSGVQINFSIVSGAQYPPKPVETDRDGNWMQSGFEPGAVYRVTPSRGRIFFSPMSTTVSGPGSQINFTVSQRRIIIIN